MSNRLLNAGGLDGVSGWNAVGGSTIAVDASVLGAPGRAALSAAHTPTDLVGLQSGRMDATAASTWEVYAGVAAPTAAPQLSVQWINEGANTVVRTDVVPRVCAGVGVSRRGLASTFDRFYGRLTRPAGADRFSLVADAPDTGGGVVLGLLKPFMAPAPADPRPTLWDPGAHNNPDLQLPAWPSELPPFQADALAQPIANAKAWAGDAGIPVREDLYRSLHFEYRPRMRLDIAGQDALDQFFAAQRDSFWVVRPDTDQLCVAEWLADGAPKPVSNSGPWTMVEVGLHLEIA